VVRLAAIGRLLQTRSVNIYVVIAVLVASDILLTLADMAVMGKSFTELDVMANLMTSTFHQYWPVAQYLGEFGAFALLAYLMSRGSGLMMIMKREISRNTFVVFILFGTVANNAALLVGYALSSTADYEKYRHLIIN